MTPTKPKPWNWLTFLKSAVNKEPSEKERRRAERLSHSWSTCACCDLPNSMRQIPMGNGLGAPMDPALQQLGYNFDHLVSWGRWSQALSIFLKIEARTAKLLKAGKKK